MNSKYLVAFIALMFLGAILAGCAQQAESKPQTEISKNTGFVQTESKTGQEKLQEAINLAVADGAYAANVTYEYHSGNETVEIGITVKNDVVESAYVQPSADANPISQKIIGGFNDALPDLVIGKKITELNLPKNVAGSSLTTAAFAKYAQRLVGGG